MGIKEVEAELEKIRERGGEYIMMCVCNDCGSELSRTKPMSGEMLYRRWGMLAIQAPRLAGPCPKACRGYDGEINLNIDLEIWEKEGDKDFILCKN